VTVRRCERCDGYGAVRGVDCVRCEGAGWCGGISGVLFSAGVVLVAVAAVVLLT